ncbi:hypothetical protein DMA12_00840 [Amycolatopsis balhimycina DSM 5908]|uniref:MOSC domain-containing protein n=1 Tax=Amycolatopsis balhimycina DSM 5908 TaxID=1081091 RepID=A0A428X655_AMYBA|nr:hypothetical protein DMA12_00840 [Amycolatopsis balhimycina DSM 5908]
MPSLLVAHHRPGFSLRVITEGQVQAGDRIVRTRAGRSAAPGRERTSSWTSEGHRPRGVTARGGAGSPLPWWPAARPGGAGGRGQPWPSRIPPA